jgi:hypothetical protein
VSTHSSLPFSIALISHALPNCCCYANANAAATLVTATRQQLLAQQADQLLTPYPLTVGEGVAAVSALRAAVGGGKDVPVVTTTVDADGAVTEVYSIVPADDNALAFARTAEEVSLLCMSLHY